DQRACPPPRSGTTPLRTRPATAGDKPFLRLHKRLPRLNFLRRPKPVPGYPTPAKALPPREPLRNGPPPPLPSGPADGSFPGRPLPGGTFHNAPPTASSTSPIRSPTACRNPPPSLRPRPRHPNSAAGSLLAPQHAETLPLTLRKPAPPFRRSYRSPPTRSDRADPAS